MNRLRSWLFHFMYGRYGVDQLYFCLLVVYFVLFFLNCFLHSNGIAALGLLLLLWACFRSFSRNHEKRRRENEVFLRFYRPVKAEAALLRDRLKDFRTARYRRCPHCGVVLRLPNRRGKHTAVCPRCGERMTVHILL